MHRILFILLVALLPVQFAWSAAASYCQHERGEATGHFGHHEHQHKSAGSAAGVEKLQKAGIQADDPDCAFCHLSCVQPITAGSALLAIAANTRQRVRAETQSFGAGVPNPIERPKWTPLA